MRRLYYFCLLFILCCYANVCQIFAREDSTHVLSVTEFVSIVTKFHPIAKQAEIFTLQAKQEYNLALAGWDPYIYSEFDQKKYQGINYYRYWENKFVLPAWYGVEVKAGYDRVEGQYINSESKLPENGLSYLGVSLPLIKNLFIDKRRAALQQASLLKKASEQQKLKMLNDLMLDALQTYYEWSYAYNEWTIYKSTLQLAKARYEATKRLAELGDKPAIDTIEALTLFQNRQIQVNEAQLNFIKKSLELNNFLWLDQDIPRPIDLSIIPEPLTSDYVQMRLQLSKLEELESQLKSKNPELLNYNFKLKQLAIDRRLKIENLKPVLNVNYNLLSNSYNFSSSTANLLANDFKWGINFAMPLSFAEGRANLKLNQLKITATRYEMSYKTQQLLNKAKSYFNELLIQQVQTKYLEESIINFKKLLEGEEQRFAQGESSLFLVNARESKLLETQIKLKELQAKYFKTEVPLKWAVGNMNE